MSIDNSKVSFFVFNADFGPEEGKAFDSIRSLNGVLSIDRLYGIHDVLVKFRYESDRQMAYLSSQIKKVDGVNNIITLVNKYAMSESPHPSYASSSSKKSA